MWVGFAPFSAHRGKTYPEEQSRELVRMLSERYGRVFIHGGGGAEQAFAALPEQTRRAYHGRYGAWYAAHGQYLHALAAYRKGEDYDAALQVIQDDAGILLAALSPEEVLAFLDACPQDTLQAHPLTLLVLMRRMFTWQQIPKMLELRALLLAGIEAHPELPDAERDNLLGECDLIMSFLQYNDIAAMSRLHLSLIHI